MKMTLNTSNMNMQIRRNKKQIENILVKRGLRFGGNLSILNFENSTLRVFNIIILVLFSEFLTWLVIFWIIQVEKAILVLSSILVSLCSSLGSMIIVLLMLEFSPERISRIRRIIKNKIKRKTEQKYIDIWEKSQPMLLLTFQSIINLIFSIVFIKIGTDLVESIFGISLAFIFQSNVLYIFSPKIIITVFGISLVFIIVTYLLRRKRRKNSSAGTKKTQIRNALLLMLGFILPILFSLLLLLLIPSYSLIILLYVSSIFIGVPISNLTITVLLNMLSSFQSLPSLIKIRAAVLGITLLAATIPFLNADSWQLVSKIEAINIIYTAGFVYIMPIILLLFSQRNVIELYWQTLWNQNERITVQQCLEISKNYGFDNNFDKILELIDISVLNSTDQEKRIVLIKYFIRGLFLFTILPIIVFLFALGLFYFVINNNLLASWTTGYYQQKMITILNFDINGWLILKIKAAGLLAILSSTSTIGTLLSSESDIKKIMRDIIVDDIREDKVLLILDRILGNY